MNKNYDGMVEFKIEIVANSNVDVSVFETLTHHMDYLVDLDEYDMSFYDVKVDLENDIVVTGYVSGTDKYYLEDAILIDDWTEIDYIKSIQVEE